MSERRNFKITMSDRELLRNMEPFVDRLLFVCMVIAFVGYIYVINTFSIFYFFAVIDFMIFLILFHLVVYRKRITVEVKVGISIAMLISFGTIGYHVNGLFSAGAYISLTGVLIAVVFVNIRVALIIAFLVSLKGVHYFVNLVSTTDRTASIVMSGSELITGYLMAYVGMFILCLVILVVVWALKKFLFENINTVHEQMTILEEQNKSLQEMNNEVEYLAFFNTLTGLPNKTKFKLMVQKHLKEKQEGTLILVDVKSFQKFNAFYGMDKGDEFLKFMGEYVKNNLNYHFELGYLGNNSLGIWVPYQATKEAITELHDNQLKNFQLNSYFDFQLELYVVAAVRTSRLRTYDDLYNVADKAMKLAKHNNLDEIVFIDQAYINEIESYENFVTFLSDTIDEGTFEIFYQDKVDTLTGRVIGLEALSRVRKDDIILTPDSFIEVIENSKLASKFGQVVLKKVISDLPELISIYGEDIVVSVNVSPQQMGDTDFIKNINQDTKNHQHLITHLELEITENILLSDMERSVMILNFLRVKGFSIAIDDFGTGYSSMRYIAELPIDVIKIDKSFIKKLELSHKTSSIVKAIVEIAHANNLRVVAEGVERVEQVQILQQMGCRIVQGYLYSMPTPLSQLGMSDEKRQLQSIIC